MVCFLAYILFQMFYYRNLRRPLPRERSLLFVTHTSLESLEQMLPSFIFPAS
jgi:hypothetical protein